MREAGKIQLQRRQPRDIRRAADLPLERHGDEAAMGVADINISI